jgi:hypothetical protein
VSASNQQSATRIGRCGPERGRDTAAIGAPDPLPQPLPRRLPGWALDAANESWIRVPRLGRGHVLARIVVNAGRQLLAFGGARFDAKYPPGEAGRQGLDLVASRASGTTAP